MAPPEISQGWGSGRKTRLGVSALGSLSRLTDRRWLKAPLQEGRWPSSFGVRDTCLHSPGNSHSEMHAHRSCDVVAMICHRAEGR